MIKGLKVMILAVIAVAALALPIAYSSSEPKASKTANIELNQNNMVLLRGEVTDESVNKASVELYEQVKKRGTNSYTIFIVLDTPGGSIDAGLAFVEFAKTFKKVETLTIFAASMGSAIVEHLPFNRNIVATGTLMFHRAAGGVQGQFEDGELESRLAYYKTIVRSMEQTNADRMGLKLSDYKSKVKDELWIYGVDSIKDGSADTLATVSCSDELVAGKDVIEISIMGFMVIPVEFSKCPLLKGGEVKGDQKAKNAYSKYLEDNSWGSK
jgi:ATP-dependent protease ClpP protease subunit